MDRLKVSDFYKELTPFTAIHIPQLTKAFFVKDSLYVTEEGQPYNVHCYSLISKLKQFTISLPYQDLGGLVQLCGLVCFYFRGNQSVWVYNGRELLQMKSHFAAVSGLVVHENQLFSGSVDMTVRRWNVLKDRIVQDSKMHVLTGHTSKINCFLNLSHLLLSGSKDKTIIAWSGSNILAHKLFGSAVNKMVLCQQSDQIAVLQESNTISIICLSALLKQGKFVINRVLAQVTIKRVSNMLQMDNSFLELIGSNQIQISQINIGKVMSKPQLDSIGTIVDSMCIRRLTMLAVAGRGLVIITF